MKCQNCGENEANVKYTQIVNGVKKQMNLCDKCARKLGIDEAFSMPSIDFSNFLGGMFDDEFSDFLPSLGKPQTLLCDKCGSTYDDFVENGKLGCDECYNTFSNQIDTLLKNIHGANRHVGRTGKMITTSENKTNQKEEKNKVGKQVKKDEKQISNKKDKENKIEELQARLKQEIEEERYEDAAKTRDEIKKLEK